MGTNTLITRSAGNVIPSSDHNGIVQALSTDLVPRVAGVPTDVGGGVGTATFRWASSYFNEVFVGLAAGLINFGQSGSDLIVKVGGNTVGKWTTAGTDGSYLNTESVRRISLEAGQIGLSTGSGTSSHNSTSYQTVVSVDKSVYAGHYYEIGLIADAGSGTSLMKIEQATASHILGYVRILLDNATTIFETTLESQSSAGAATRTLAISPSSIRTIWLAPSTAAVNFKIQTKVDATFTCTITTAIVKGFAKEVGGN